MLEKIDKALKVYKSDTGKLSFTDMISHYVEQCSPPKLEILIVDEAQDLVPLQWWMVLKLAETQRRYILRETMTRRSTDGRE